MSERTGLGSHAARLALDSGWTVTIGRWEGQPAVRRVRLIGAADQP
jgi:hypothetical protein